MADGYRIYESERGFPLLYVYQPPTERPILTLENYTKWYEGMYLVDLSGNAVKVTIQDVEKVMDDHGDAMWIDHCYHPRLLHRVAQQLNADLDERALEVAIGRWMLESGTCDREVKFLKFDEPASES